MPINSLQRAPQFPLIGRLRKGAPKGDRRPGQDLQYFRFESEGKTDPGLEALFKRIYGDKPAAIKVYMPFATLAENFSAWREHRSGTRLFHVCDGDHVWERQGGTLQPTTKPCPTRDLDDRDAKGGKNPNKCHPVGRLSMIVKGLGRFGYVMLTTTSIIDISRLNAEIGAIETMAGDLRNIPMILRRIPEQIPTQMGENRGLVTKYMLHIEIDDQWAAARLAAMDESALIDAMAPRAALATPSAVQALPAPRTIEHNGYRVNPASGEVIQAQAEAADVADLDDDEAEFWPDEDDRAPLGAEPPTPEPTKAPPALARMSAGQIKQAWRDLEKQGVEIPESFWKVNFNSLDAEGYGRAAQWIADRRAELAAK